jgi:HD-like signal output (HDOD) protein/DNA-binding response OmpR family regulator
MKNMIATATILIVEDDVAVRELLVLALEANAFEAIAVGNIQDAMARLSSEHVDLLLLDLKLGTENGIDLLKQVRQMPGYDELPIILLTGCADRNIILQIAHLGVQGYVLKHQFSRKQLIERINQQLATRQAEYRAPSTVEPQPGSAISAENPISEISPTETAESRAIGSSESFAEYESDISQAGAAGAALELLRSVNPVVTRSQSLALADRCAELKVLPSIVHQLAQVSAEPSCSLEQIANIVKLDQGMVLKVLKTANSVAYGCERTIDNARDALSRIGVSQVRQLVLNTIVADDFCSVDLGEHFNHELFWEHSVATAQIAATIAQLRNGDRHAIEFAYTMGLLHDIGRLVLVQQLDDIYKGALNTAARLQLPLDLVESRMLLVNHADLIYRLFDKWNFPRSLAKAIALHHLPFERIRRLPPRNMEDVATLALANRLAHSLLLGSSGNGYQYPAEELVQVLDLKPDVIKQIEDRIPEQTRISRSSIVNRDEQSPHYDYRTFLLKRFHGPIRPLYISTHPEIDGYRILFDRLMDSTDTKRKNIAIIHLTNLGDTDSLFASLREQERATDIKHLPLIILSPLPKPTPDPQLLADREFKIVPSPFSLLRLTDTINSLLLS